MEEHREPAQSPFGGRLVLPHELFRGSRATATAVATTIHGWRPTSWWHRLFQSCTIRTAVNVSGSACVWPTPNNMPNQPGMMQPRMGNASGYNMPGMPHQQQVAQIDEDLQCDPAYMVPTVGMVPSSPANGPKNESYNGLRRPTFGRTPFRRAYPSSKFWWCRCSSL